MAVWVGSRVRNSTILPITAQVAPWLFLASRSPARHSSSVGTHITPSPRATTSVGRLPRTVRVVARGQFVTRVAWRCGPRDVRLRSGRRAQPTHAIPVRLAERHARTPPCTVAPAALPWQMPRSVSMTRSTDTGGRYVMPITFSGYPAEGAQIEESGFGLPQPPRGDSPGGRTLRVRRFSESFQNRKPASARTAATQ